MKYVRTNISILETDLAELKEHCTELHENERNFSPWVVKACQAQMRRDRARAKRAERLNQADS